MKGSVVFLTCDRLSGLDVRGLPERAQRARPEAEGAGLAPVVRVRSKIEVWGCDMSWHTALLVGLVVVGCIMGAVAISYIFFGFRFHKNFYGKKGSRLRAWSDVALAAAIIITPVISFTGLDTVGILQLPALVAIMALVVVASILRHRAYGQN